VALVNQEERVSQVRWELVGYLVLLEHWGLLAQSEQLEVLVVLV